MRVLITGGAGFIGSHLAEAWLELGAHVTIVDDLSTGSFDNIAHLRDRPDFVYRIDTMMNRPVMAQLVDQADLIFHMAAAVGVKLIVQSPVRTIETNVRGTEILLDLAVRKNRKVFIASTSEVYGKSESIPFSEDGDLVLGATVKGRWAYACSKAIDEFLALAYHRERDLPAVIVRLFNTVGPRQTGRYGMVVPTFVRQALTCQPITVHGDGTQRRCFTFVNDVVRALVDLAAAPEAVGRVFNIGNDEEISIAGLAELVKELTGSPSEIEYVPYEQAFAGGFEDMPRRVPDLTRIRNLVGYEPTLGIREIIREVITDQAARLPVRAHAAESLPPIPPGKRPVLEPPASELTG